MNKDQFDDLSPLGHDQEDAQVCTDGYCSTCGAIALFGANYCETHQPLSAPVRREQNDDDHARVAAASAIAPESLTTAATTEKGSDR